MSMEDDNYYFTHFFSAHNGSFDRYISWYTVSFMAIANFNVVENHSEILSVVR